MSANKIDRTLTTDAQALARFQQTQRAAKEAGQAAESSPAEGTTRAAAPDRVEISDAAQRLHSLRELVDAGRRSIEALPEVRADRVAEVRRSLEAGAYATRDVKDSLAAKLAPVLRDLDQLLD
jgi:anti-sigma28 factor (negative regulator of flagellin synthesis)